MEMITHELLIASLIKEINSKVREPWTKTEDLYGKVISVAWEDIDIVKEVVPKFLAKGWLFNKKEALLEASGRKILLHICRPPM